MSRPPGLRPGGARFGIRREYPRSISLSHDAPMDILFAYFLIIFLLSSIAVVLRRGFNELIRGLESIDQRLASIERIRSSDSPR
jgi:hypothetical protein